MLRIIPPKRDRDRWGSGHWGARRGDREHQGIDYHCIPGSVCLSTVNGHVTKLGFPYADQKRSHLRYVEVTNDCGHKHRFFYIKPLVTEGSQILKGNAIGIVQTLQDIYPDISDHIHYEIIVNGEKVNPEEY